MFGKKKKPIEKDGLVAIATNLEEFYVSLSKELSDYFKETNEKAEYLELLICDLQEKVYRFDEKFDNLVQMPSLIEEISKETKVNKESVKKVLIAHNKKEKKIDLKQPLKKQAETQKKEVESEKPHMIKDGKKIEVNEKELLESGI